MIRTDEVTSNLIYDRLAESYGSDAQQNTTTRLTNELIAKYTKKTDRVIDFGCANGVHIKSVAPLCASIVGIDINEKMLGTAADHCKQFGIDNVTLHQCSAMSIDFPDEYFNLAYAFSILLLVPDTLKAIEEMVRVTKTGGLVVLDITGRYNLSKWHWSRYYQKQGHFGINAFSHAEILGYLQQIGLQMLEEHALGFTDQWKYIPLLGRCHFIDKIFHSRMLRDLDYLISNNRIIYGLANRWFIVCRKRSLDNS